MVRITELGKGSIVTVEFQKGYRKKVRISQKACQGYGQANSNRGVIAYELGNEQNTPIKKRRMNLSPRTAVLEIHRGSKKQSRLQRRSDKFKNV